MNRISRINIVAYVFKQQQPKTTRRNMAWFKELVKQFKNSDSPQLYDPKNQIMYQVLLRKHMDEACRVNAEAMVHNPILKLCKMSAKEYFVDSRVICQFSVDSGLGCIAKDDHDQIVGVCMAYPLDAVYQAHHQVSNVHCSHEINSLWDAMLHLLMTVPWHQYGDPSRILYVDDISVLKSASGRGIGYVAVEVSMVLAQRKGFTHMVGLSFNDVAADDATASGGLNVIRTMDISEITEDGHKIFQHFVNKGTHYLRLHVIRLNPSKL